MYFWFSIIFIFRNCLQFEPDHPMYIKTTDAVFSHVSEHRHFDSLYSTRLNTHLVNYPNIKILLQALWTNDI